MHISATSATGSGVVHSVIAASVWPEGVRMCGGRREGRGRGEGGREVRGEVWKEPGLTWAHQWKEECEGVVGSICVCDGLGADSEAGLLYHSAGRSTGKLKLHSCSAREQGQTTPSIPPTDSLCSALSVTLPSLGVGQAAGATSSSREVMARE